MGCERRAGCRVPDVHVIILAERGDVPTIGRPGDDDDPVGVPAMGQQETLLRRVPDMHRFIFAGGGERATIRRPGDSPDPAMMTPIGGDLTPVSYTHLRAHETRH